MIEILSKKPDPTVRIKRIDDFQSRIFFDTRRYEVLDQDIEMLDARIQVNSNGLIILEAPHLQIGIIELVYNPMICREEAISMAENTMVRFLKTCDIREKEKSEDPL